MTAYYNENDPYPAQWLRNLIDAGEIASGVVDERSILDVQATDLDGYDRCHFFAGIGGWDYALRLANWPEEWPIWTGSCPCQPFSAAGRRSGGADKRHLWPYWFYLIQNCQPPIIVGEQVASKDGLKWLDVVFSDLEAAGYSCGAADLCAAGLGAPHIRQRLWFVAYAKGIRWSNSGIIGNLGKKKTKKNERRKGRSFTSTIDHNSPTGELADSNCSRFQIHRKSGSIQRQGTFRANSEVDNPWHSLHWLPCRDGKLRPTGVMADSWLTGRWRNGEGFKSSQERRNVSCLNDQDYPEPRPTQSIFQFIFDGLSPAMGDLWNDYTEKIERWVIDCAKKTKTRPGEILREMWHQVGQESLQWDSGGHEQIPESEILFIALCKLAGDKRTRFQISAHDLSKIQEGTVRTVWHQAFPTIYPSCTPQGWELEESFHRELANTLCSVSPTAPQHQKQEMPLLRKQIPQVRDVSEALSEMAALWRSLLDQSAEDGSIKRFYADKDAIIAMAGQPLAKNVPNRIGMLRGAGNAIVPQVAATFIKAVMEILDA